MLTVSEDTREDVSRREHLLITGFHDDNNLISIFPIEVLIVKTNSLEAKRRIYNKEKMLRNKLYRYGKENGRVPVHIHFGKEVFDNMVKNKDLVALINADTGEQMTYGEVAQLTADVALSLTRIGVGKGDVVCICSEKIFEYLPTVVGVTCTGATFTSSDPTYGSVPLIHRLKIARPKVMFSSLSAYETHKASFDEVGSIQHYIIYGNETKDGAILFKEFLTETTKLEDFQPVPINGWEDVAFIIYSSGTTGLPKGIPVTHLGYLSVCHNMVKDEYTGIGIYNGGEYYYTNGLMYGLACLRVGASIVYNPSGGELAMLKAIQKYKLKILQIAPTTAIGLVNSSILDNYDVSTVKYIVTVSTYVWEEAMRGIKKRLPYLEALFRQYGMTECGVVCNEMFNTKGYKAGSSGMPGNGVVIKVVDVETREPLGPNQRGEICVKGYCVMKAYLNNANPDCKDEEGFMKTGDIGYYDEDGYFYIVNRIKELIKFNGISVAPAEFEALLLQHPSVREAGVVGKPHLKHGEVPVAFIVLQPGCTATEEELVQYVDSRVTYRMRLAGGVRFIDCLPRAVVGDKIERRDLMKRLLDENVATSIQLH